MFKEELPHCLVGIAFQSSQVKIKVGLALHIRVSARFKLTPCRVSIWDNFKNAFLKMPFRLQLASRTESLVSRLMLLSRLAANAST